MYEGGIFVPKNARAALRVSKAQRQKGGTGFGKGKETKETRKDGVCVGMTPSGGKEGLEVGETRGGIIHGRGTTLRIAAVHLLR